MLGTIVNAAAILVGGTLGLLLKKGIPERVSSGIMQGLGLIVIYIGISGMLKGQNILIATISIVIGGAIGMILDFDVTTEDPRFNRRFYRAALDNEALLRPIGNTVYLMPPYVLSESDAEWLAGQMLSALHATLA